MRISDWSSDVCSSDLLQDLSGLRVVCVRVQDHGVSLLINGAELGGEALEVLGVVEKVSCGDLVELVRLTLRVCGGAVDRKFDGMAGDRKSTRLNSSN